jgi:hypothetical protein
MTFEMLFILVERLRRMSLEVSAISPTAELFYGHYKPNAHCFSYDVVTVHVLGPFMTEAYLHKSCL